MRGLIVIAASAIIGMAMPQSGGAAELASASRLVASPKSFVGKTIRVVGLRCITDQELGFSCLLLADGKMLEIEASGLGSKTRVELGYMIDNCVGTDSRTRDECVMTATFSPVSFEKSVVNLKSGAMPTTTINTNEIEFER